MEEKVYMNWNKVLGYATPGGDPVFRCSNCGKEFIIGIESNIKQEPDECPNCGAIRRKPISNIII